MRKTYHMAKLSAYDFGIIRSPGPGLGNLLLPIARALIGAERAKGVFIFPTIRQLKVGTFLRREPDKRVYGDELRGRGAIEWVRWIFSHFRPSVTEGCYVEYSHPVTVRYEGLGRFFHDLSGHEKLIKSWIELNSNTKNRTRPERYIALHIRLGDFAESGSASEGFSVKTSFEWYLRALKLVLEKSGTSKTKNIVIFTDSDHERIRAGLGISNIIFDNSSSAMEAIIKMSQAEYLVTSRSTFSMWAAFLGESTCIWHAGLRVDDYYPISERDIVIE